MLGLYMGSAFLGGAPTTAPPPAMEGLPAGHPAVDPRRPVPAPPLPSGSGGIDASGMGDVRASAGQTSGAALGNAPAGAAAPNAPSGTTTPTASSTGTAPPPGTPPEQGGYDLAFDDPAIRAAIARSSNYEELVRVGNQQFDARHPQLAVAAYEKALKLHPFDPNAQTDLGVMYRALHRHDDALTAFRRAANMDPQHAESRYNIGVVLASDENDPKGAIAAWNEYLRISPNDARAPAIRRQIADMKAALARAPKG